MRTRTIALLLGGTALAVTGTTLPGPAAHAAAPACSAQVLDDVNGDGYGDVAVSDRSRADAGSVHLFYGQAGGLVVDRTGTALDDQLLSQDTAGVPGDSEADDDFGAATAFGDFDGDGCADLAVGVPGEDTGTGQVMVFRGSPSGLRTSDVRAFGEDALLGAGAAAQEEEFGAVLTAADLDGDGRDDLVVGVPGELVDGQDAGAVVLVPGGAGGLDLGAARLVSQASAGVAGAPEAGDGFGAAVAAGDLDGNDRLDLAVGVPGENGTGAVEVLGDSGASTVVSQASPGVPGRAETGDQFGATLAAGDVTGDGTADLAVGVPGENSKPDDADVLGQGAVTFLPGSPGGVTGTGSQGWSQASPGVEGKAGGSDTFGSSLVLAHLDGDKYADLAVGTPFDSVGGAKAAGSVTLLRGSATGLTTAGRGGERITQDSAGIPGTPEAVDFFGYALAAAPIQAAVQQNLVIGAPLESLTRGDDQAGVVHQLALGDSGPRGSGGQTFSLDRAGVKGSPGTGFGSALS